MKNINRYRLEHSYHRLCCYAVILLFAILGLSSNMVLADQSNQDEVRAQLKTLHRQKNEIDGVISGLNGKPAQLQKFQKTLVDNYKYLARQSLRLQGIQLWNGFVGFVGVAFDCLQKVNPGSNAAIALMTFAQDRASATLSNANLNASINDLSGEIKKVGPSLRLLDRTLKMTPAEVADEMVASGMVKDIDSIAVRWDGTIRLRSTPEELAKSAAVVTAKITFIQGRMKSAMKTLYHTKISTGKSIIAIAEYLANAKKKSRELGIQIAELESQIEYEKIIADSSEPALNTQPDISSDIAPKRHSHAFADIKSAWVALRANTIDGQTYEKIKSRMQTASLLYEQQQMKPFDEKYDKVRDYWFNKMSDDMRAISDRSVRDNFYNRKRAEFQLAEDQFFKAQDKQRIERNKEFFEPLKLLHEEELQELQRLKEFDNRVKALYKTQVTTTYIDHDLGVYTGTGQLNSMITSKNLATVAWAGVFGPRLVNSFQVYTIKAAPLAREAIVKAERLLSGAGVTSSEVQAIIGQAEALASELESNLKLWNYLINASDLGGAGFVRLPSEWLPSIKVSSKVFNLQVNTLRPIAMDEYESLKEQATQVIQAAAVRVEQERQLGKAKIVFSNWTQARNIRANNALNSQGVLTKDFLQENHLTHDRIQKIKKIIPKLEKSPKDIETYVLKGVAGGRGRDLLIPDDAQLKIIKEKYMALKSNIEKKRIAYPKQYASYQESYSELEESLFTAQSHCITTVPALAASFSIEAIMAKAGQQTPMSEWALPDPIDLPEQDPADDALLQEFADVVTRYNKLIDPYREKAQKRYKTALVKMKELARKPLTRAILQYDISPEEFEKRVANITTDAKKIYEPLAFLDGDSLTTDFGMSYKAFTVAIGRAQRQYLMSWMVKVDKKIETIRNDLQTGKLSDLTQKENYIKEFRMLIAQDSFADRLRRDGHRELSDLIVRIEDLLDQLTRKPNIKPADNSVTQIKEFYNRFKEAYESKDEYQVVSLISDDWGANDGTSISDLEDNLHNMFAVFDEIQYHLSEFSVQEGQAQTYRVSYKTTIMGTIYESNITRTEKSSVQELVKIDNGTVKILKTLAGNFWYID